MQKCMYDIVSSLWDTDPPPPHTHSKRCPHYMKNESNTHYTHKTGHEGVPGVWRMSLLSRKRQVATSANDQLYYPLYPFILW